VDATLEKASKLFLACAFKPVGARRGIFQVTELGFIMDSLTVSERRHLALPDGCLFSPTELQINPSLSQNEFSRLGKVLASVDHASDLWECDFALAGQKRWGDEGLKLAAAATRLSLGYLKVSARIAERFEPTRRFPNLTRESYRGLVCFPVEFTDAWLPTVVEKGFSAKTLRALAVEAFGSDPKGGYSKNKKRQVSVPETLYARLKECSPTPKTAVFIEMILADFASNGSPEQAERIAAALSTRDADKVRQRRGVKTKREKKEKPTPKPKEPEIIEPADVRFQLEKFRKTYGERRAEQIENGAETIPVKSRSSKNRLRIQWTPCRAAAFLDTENGPVQFQSEQHRVARFASEEKARLAEEKNFVECGYHELVVFCKVCNAWHVAHQYTSAAAPASQTSVTLAYSQPGS
jgi:hypothetical protein